MHPTRFQDWTLRILTRLSPGRAMFCSALAILSLGYLSGSSSAPGTGPAVTSVATFAEAAAALDLTTFPLPEKLTYLKHFSPLQLSYQTPGKVKDIFGMHCDELRRRGWTQLPGGAEFRGRAYRKFTRNGFMVQLDAHDIAQQVAMTMTQLGNLRVELLPAPAESRLWLANENYAIYLTSLSPDEATQACKDLLRGDGWQFYDFVKGGLKTFKRNALVLKLHARPEPKLDNRILISYSSIHLSADLPVPDNAFNVECYEPDWLRFDAPGSESDVVRFYQQTLAQQGWTATPATSLRDANSKTLQFINKSGEILQLTIYGGNGVSVKLKHITNSRAAAPPLAFKKLPGSAATLAEAARLLDLRTVPLPAGVTSIETQTLSELNYCTSGTRADAFEFHRRQLVENGWQPMTSRTTAACSFERGFEREGFEVWLEVFSGEEGQANVRMANSGNGRHVAPLPFGSDRLTTEDRERISFDVYLSEEDAQTCCDQILRANGWIPYGDDRGRCYKQNSVRLSVSCGAVIDAGLTTAVWYYSELLAFDLPAPEATMHLVYDDKLGTLHFASHDSFESLFQFYRGALGELGWRPQSAEPTLEDDVHVWKFAKGAHESLRLEIDAIGDIRRVSLQAVPAPDTAKSPQ